MLNVKKKKHKLYYSSCMSLSLQEEAEGGKGWYGGLKEQEVHLCHGVTEGLHQSPELLAVSCL